VIPKDSLYCVFCFIHAQELCSAKENIELAIAKYKCHRKMLKLRDKSDWLSRMMSPYNSCCLECGGHRQYAKRDFDLYKL